MLSRPTVRAIVNQAPASATGGIMLNAIAQARKIAGTQRGQRMRCSDHAPSVAAARQSSVLASRRSASCGSSAGSPTSSRTAPRGSCRGYGVKKNSPMSSEIWVRKPAAIDPDHGHHDDEPAEQRGRGAGRQMRARRRCASRSWPDALRAPPRRQRQRRAAASTRKMTSDRHGRAVADAVLGEETLVEREAHAPRSPCPGRRPSAGRPRRTP